MGSTDISGLCGDGQGRAGRIFGRKKKSMTTIWVDSRKRVAGTDSDFEFDVGETVHLQGSARLGVFKTRVADTFLSTDRGAYLYRKDTALSTLFASATYVESRNELEVAHDQPADPERAGVAHAVSRQRQLPAGRPPGKPLSIMANAADTVGPLGHDIIAKIVCKQGVGHITWSTSGPDHAPVPPLQAHRLRGQRGQPARHQPELLRLPGRVSCSDH